MTASQSVFKTFNSNNWMNFAFVLIGVLLATLIRFPIQPVIHGASPFLFYIPVVVAVAVTFGFRCGLFATLLSVVPANYYWMGVEGAFEMDLGEFCQILGFSVAGISVSWLSSSARKRKQLEEHLRATLTSISEAIVTADCDGKIVYVNAAAQMLTELQGQDVSGSMISSVLNLVAEDGGHPLNGTFHLAVVNDDIEDLPRRVILLSRSGRQHRVEQKTSRILDGGGRKIGMSILFRCLEGNTVTFPSAEPAKLDVLKTRSLLPRIAMVANDGCPAVHVSWISAGDSAQALYVRELSKKLAQGGYEVDIWTRSLAGHPEIECVTQRVRIIRVSEARPMTIEQETATQPAWCRPALQTIRQHGLKYEIISSHGAAGGVAGKYLSSELRVSHMHTPHSFRAAMLSQTRMNLPHGGIGSEEKNDLPQSIDREHSLFAGVDMIIATSLRQQEILSRHYAVPGQKQYVIPCGFDEGRFFPVSDAVRKSIRMRLGITGPLVETTWRLTDGTNGELLIQAFGLVWQQMPEVTFYVLIGSTVLASEEVQAFIRLRALVTEQGLSKKVVFKSFVSDSQIADYYRAADVFVQSSEHGPFSMTAIEAMACGTPVVAAARSSWHDGVRFGKDALYADPRNPQGLGGAILNILQQPALRSELSRAGAQTVRANLSWTATAQQFLALVDHADTGHRDYLTYE